jgi:flagellar operon protein (TIGR03826 family)
MSLNLANCPKCGKLYAKNIRNLCPACVKEIEDLFQSCIDYLRKHRKCTLAELSEGAGVTKGMIANFIREGRISIGDFPNLTYECEVCGTNIREGHLCESCRVRLNKDLQNIKEDERKAALRQNFQQQYGGFLKDRDLSDE